MWARTLLLLLTLSSGSVSVTGQPRGSSYNIKPGVQSAGAFHARRAGKLTPPSVSHSPSPLGARTPQPLQC